MSIMNGAKPRHGLVRLSAYSVVTGLLIWALLSQIEPGVMYASFAAAAFWPWALAVVLNTLPLLLMARRWQFMLRCDGITIAYPRLALIYLESSFFSLFLPSAVGGDLFRGARAYGEYKSVARTATSLLVERMIGLWAVCALGVISQCFVSVSSQLQLAFFAVLAAIVLGSVLLHWGTSRPRLSPLLGALRLGHVAAQLEALGAQARAYLGRPRLFCVLLGLSALQQALGVLAVYAVDRSVGVGLSVSFYMVTMPVVWVVSLLPALGGLGPREAALYFALTSEGVSGPQAVTLGVLLYATLLVRGAAGGLTWLSRALLAQTKAAAKPSFDTTS